MNTQAALLFYLFIGIFSITAIITLLGITGVLKSIKDKYLNALFGALILEVVAAVILSYKQIDIGSGSDAIEPLIELLGDEKTDSEVKNIALLESTIKDAIQLEVDNIVLNEKIKELENILNTKGEEHSYSDKEFLMYIITLREITRNEMDGTSINLVFNRAEKKKVFDILEQVFMSLGKVDPGVVITPDYLTSVYVKFLSKYSLEDKLVSINENGAYTGVYLTDYVTSLMIRAYLEKFYPIK